MWQDSALLTTLHVNYTALWVTYNQPKCDPLHTVWLVFDFLCRTEASFLSKTNSNCRWRNLYISQTHEFLCLYKEYFILSDADTILQCNTDNSILALMLQVYNDFLGQRRTISMNKFHISISVFDALWRKKTLADCIIMHNISNYQRSFTGKTEESWVHILAYKPLVLPRMAIQRDVSMLTTKHTMTASM